MDDGGTAAGALATDEGRAIQEGATQALANAGYQAVGAPDGPVADAPAPRPGSAVRPAGGTAVTTPPWEGGDRRRQLARLRVEVGRVQAALQRVQTETRRLAAIEATRRLTVEEAKQVATVRRESEALRLELTLFRREFERLRETGTAERAQTGTTLATRPTGPSRRSASLRMIP